MNINEIIEDPEFNDLTIGAVYRELQKHFSDLKTYKAQIKEYYIKKGEEARSHDIETNTSTTPITTTTSTATTNSIATTTTTTTNTSSANTTNSKDIVEGEVIPITFLFYFYIFT